MADYSQDVLDAAEDIKEAGEAVVVTLINGVVANPDKPWEETASGPQTWEDIYLCYIPDGSAEWRAYTKGTDVPVGATLALMAGNVPFTPTQEHRITSPSRGKLKIDGFDKLAPGGETIMYTLRLVQ